MSSTPNKKQEPSSSDGNDSTGSVAPQLPRSELSFSQAEGLEPLPIYLDLGQMPDKFRNKIWAMLYELLSSIGIWKTTSVTRRHPVIKYIWVDCLVKPLDQFDSSDFIDTVKAIIFDAEYGKVFDFLELLLRFIASGPDRYGDSYAETVIEWLTQDINEVLVREKMAYYLDTSESLSFIPQASQQEGETIRDALSILNDTGFKGPQSCLFKASKAINDARFADAVHESISAVESIIKRISGNKKDSFNDALKKLEDNELLTHPALKKAFIRLYGYTSDEEGIRHALVFESEANVGLEEALFMFGACASFCGYLCRKHTQLE